MFIYINGEPEKRTLVDDMGFGGLSYLPNEYLNQRLLKQIYDRYDVHDNTIYSDVAAVKITTDKIGHALGLSSRGTPYDTKVARNELSEEDKEVYDYFKGFTTVALQDLIKATPVDTEENKKLWMRAFILFVQKEQLKKKSTKRVPSSDSESQTEPEPPYSNSTNGEGDSMSNSDETISEQPPQQKEIRSKRRLPDPDNVSLADALINLRKRKKEAMEIRKPKKRSAKGNEADETIHEVLRSASEAIAGSSNRTRMFDSFDTVSLGRDNITETQPSQPSNPGN
ncbi:hypothetical protein PIB30_087824, partial [Stylosanthes scabra]|nr:hypothetical protein [Stylosanthes scabra]